MLALAAACAALSACAGGDVAAPDPVPSAPAAPAAAAVSIEGYAYRPATITMRRGDRVVWTDRGRASHTVSFQRGPGDLGDVDPGERLSARFPDPGRFRFACAYHPGMRGRVIVR